MKALVLVVLGVAAAIHLSGCLSTRPLRDSIPTPAGPASKAEVAGEIRTALDSRDSAAAARIAARIGEESDAGFLLARGLAEARAAGDFAPLAAPMEEALDALSLEIVVEADVPRDWPEPSSPGLVRVKSYPPVRLARVRADETQNSLFRELFRHIDANDIPMTSPVEMNVPGEPGEAFMSFLYASPESGPAGREGAVTVMDAEPLTVVSVGIRGAYTDENFRDGLGRLREWLGAPGCGWTAAGAPRVLAYNSPFVPWFLKFSEVQVPVARR